MRCASCFHLNSEYVDFYSLFSHTPTLTDGSGALRCSDVKAARRWWGRTFTCSLMASPADCVTDPLHINSKTHATHAHYQACMQTADYWYLQLLKKTTTLHSWHAKGHKMHSWGLLKWKCSKTSSFGTSVLCIRVQAHGSACSQTSGCKCDWPAASSAHWI